MLAHTWPQSTPKSWRDTRNRTTSASRNETTLRGRNTCRPSGGFPTALSPEVLPARRGRGGTPLSFAFSFGVNCYLLPTVLQSGGPDGLRRAGTLRPPINSLIVSNNPLPPG